MTVTAKTVTTPQAKALIAPLKSADTTPIAEATVFRALVQGGWAPAEIAPLWGKGTQQVVGRLDLFDLAESGLKALAAGTLPVGLAWYIAKVSPESQALLLGGWERGNFTGARHAEAYARSVRAAEEQRTQTA
ncbi:hypothetical protein [Streptomyces sp900116325]|uniref:hypothetical protein n=1 Tax=Streptomyces sp. 900116325 TaxID=3154295 RepID=UPI00340B097C